MDKISDAINCYNCMDILSTPILLPCGHSICKVHCDVPDKEVICSRCGLSHPNCGFVVNLGLANIVSSRVGSFDLGSPHKEAKEACDKLDEILFQIYHILKDPSDYTFTVIDEMRKNVLLKSEKLKLELENNTKKLLDLLDIYEKECENNLKGSICVSKQARLEGLQDEPEKQLKEWYAVLNKLKVDENKWKSIKEECDKKLDELNKELNDFKKTLLSKSYMEQAARVNFFSNVNLKSIFKFKCSNIKSSILSQSQKVQLRDLCEISPQTKWKLLWRGSRDGFGAHDFHSKCDNIPNNFTIIKTTKGYIFGGYTELTWNGTGYGRDPNAYIFSMVNEIDSPFVMKIVIPESAISRSQLNGPIFGGGHDICISNNSNTSEYNLSRISSYMPPDNLEFNQYMLANSRYFQVKEIEVFKLEKSRNFLSEN